MERKRQWYPLGGLKHTLTLRFRFANGIFKVIRPYWKLVNRHRWHWTGFSLANSRLSSTACHKEKYLCFTLLMKQPCHAQVSWQPPFFAFCLYRTKLDFLHDSEQGQGRLDLRLCETIMVSRSRALVGDGLGPWLRLRSERDCKLLKDVAIFYTLRR